MCADDPRHNPVPPSQEVTGRAIVAIPIDCIMLNKTQGLLMTMIPYNGVVLC